MIENKFSEVFPHNASEKKKAEKDPSLNEQKLKRFSELTLAEHPRFLPKFQQSEYSSLFEKALADLFVNVEENVELNSVLVKMKKNSVKNATPQVQEKLERSIRNSLHNNSAQRSSIKKFLGLLFGDLLGLIGRKDVG